MLSACDEFSYAYTTCCFIFHTTDEQISPRCLFILFCIKYAQKLNKKYGKDILI